MHVDCPFELSWIPHLELDALVFMALSHDYDTFLRSLLYMISTSSRGQTYPSLD